MAKTRTRGAASRSLGDLLRALLAGALLAGLLGAIPYGLIRFVGWPLPDHMPTLDMLQQAVGFTTIIDTLAVLLWAAWLQFTVCVLVEFKAAVSGRGWAVPIPAAGVNQVLARKLVTTLLLVSAGTMTLGQAANAATLPAQAPPVAAVALAQPAPAAVITTPAAATTTVAATVHQAPPAGTKLYVVQPPDGRHTDTLWDIAERHLGDGMRYKQILDLNRDRVQPDGSRLTNESLVRPGWQLVMPGDATGPGLTTEQPAPPATTGPAQQTVTVHPGDTLSAIAEQTLGDADKYPELTEANKGHVMADGRTFQSPDLIFPGWTISIPQPAQAPAATQTLPPAAEQPAPHPPVATPTTPSAPATPAPAQTAPAATSTPAPTQSSAAPTAAPSVAASAPASTQQTPKPTESAVPSPAASVAHETTIATAQSATVDIASIATWGGLAAAGILSALGSKRMLQQRSRRRGQRIRMPQETPAPVAKNAPTDQVTAAADKLTDLERRLRATEDPTGADLIDRALRTLAARLGDRAQPLPQLAAVRLSPTSLDLFLQEDSTEAVAPFTATADPARWTCPTTGVDLLDPEAAHHVAAPYPALATLGRVGDDLILVDLEALGVLLLDADTARPFVRALAIELASAPWRDDLGVSLIGLDDGLTALDSGYGRLQPVGTVADALTEITSWNETVRDALARTNTPTVRHARTTSLTPDSWTPRIAVSALPLSTADLSAADQLAAEPLCGALIAPAAASDLRHIVRLPGPDGGPITIGTLTLDQVVPQRITDEDFDALMTLFGITTEPPLDGPIPEPEEVQPTTVPEARELPAPAPAAPDAPAPAQAELPFDLHDDDVELPEPTGPVINLLGPASIAGVDPTTVPAAASVRLTEVAAWIALHPGGPMPQLTTDLSPSDPNATSAAGLVSALRRWLGNDANDAPHLLHDTGEGLRFAPTVTSDWDQFLTLTRRDTHRARRLALDLVDSRPFADAPPRRYIWAEGYRQQMIAAIVDVAEQVAEQCLDISDHRGALAAADTGIRVEPAAEALYRLAMQAAHLAGDREGVEHYADRLEAVLERLGAQMQTATAELLRDLLSSGSTLAGSAS